MKSFFQRHSGAHKPTSDPTSNHQVWLPPAIEPNDNRTRHRTTQEPLDSTANVQGGPSRTHQKTEVYSPPHIASSGYDYTTHSSTSRGYHGSAPTQIASAAFASVTTPSYLGPGQNLNESAGWSTSLRPLPLTRPPPFQSSPMVYREYDTERRRRSDDRYRVADQRGEREQRTRERDADVARYKAKVAERSSQKKDYNQYGGRDDDRRRVLDDGREKRDRRRSRERRKREKEKESENKDHDREQERNERRERERGRIHFQEKESREAHREREGDRNRSPNRGWPTERDADRDMTSNFQRKWEQNEPEGREKDNPDFKGKARARDEEPRDWEKERRPKAKSPSANMGRCGTGGKSEVHKVLQEGNPYVTGPREMESEFNQRRQHDRVRDSDRREYRRNARKDNNYLDRRFEPGNAEWNSVLTRHFQPGIQRRYTPAHDKINSDSSPCKDLPKLSKHKRNLTDVEAPHLLITKRHDSVPSAPSDPALGYPRQATFASNSSKNQVGYGNHNWSSSSCGHHGKESISVAAERPSRDDPTAFATPSGEIGRLKYQERKTGSDPTTTFLPASSATEVTYKDVQLSNSNAGQSKYAEDSHSLPSRWPFLEKRSNSGPSLLVDNATSIQRTENQRLQEQLDYTNMIPKTMCSSASGQAALREAETFDALKHVARTVEKHSKPHSTDVPKVDSSRHPAMTHPIPSVVPAMTDAQISAIRGSRMESIASRTTGLQTSDVLNVHPSSGVHGQTQVLFMHGGQAPSDTPTVVISRNYLEPAGSKDRTLTVAHSIHEAPKVPDHLVSIHIRSTPSTTVVGRDSIAQSLARPPSTQQTSVQGGTTIPGDAPLLSFSSAAERSASQGASYPSIISNNMSEHKVTEQVSMRPVTLSNTQSVDTTINSKVSSTLDIRTQCPPSRTQSKTMGLLPSQQGESGSSFTTGNTSTQLCTPISSKQTSSTEYLPQTIFQARTQRTALENTSHLQTQVSSLYRSLQDVSVDQDSKARALPVSMHSSSAVGLNEHADHPLKSSTGILDQENQTLPINMVDRALISTSMVRPHDQLSRHPEFTESGTTRLGVHSIVQQKMTEMREEIVHSKAKPDTPEALIEASVMTNKISSQSSSIPSSNENPYQVHSPPNQAVHHVHGFAGKLLEASSHVKTRVISSNLPTPDTPTMDVNLLQSARGLNIDTSPTSFTDKKQVDSRYTNIKMSDIGEVISSSMRGPTINTVGFPSDQMPSDGPLRYSSSSESPLRDEKGQVIQRNPSILKTSDSRLLAEHQATSISNQPQSVAALQILRPSTAIGHRQISGEASIPSSTALGNVPNGDRALASAIRRPATAMSSRHSRSERPRNDVSQAHGVQSGSFLQLRSTGASDVSPHAKNPATSSTGPTNNLDVTVPVNTKGILSKHMPTEFRSITSHCPEDQTRKIQLQSYPNTLESELGLPVANTEVSTLDVDGASTAQAARDVAVVQHHVTYDSTLAPTRNDKNAVSFGQYQPKEFVNRVIAVPQGDQPPIQNAKLAELLSNPVPSYQHVPTPETANSLQNPREVISRLNVTRIGSEQPTTQLIRPEVVSSNQKTREDPGRSPHGVDSRETTVQRSTHALQQSQSPRNNLSPSRAMLVSASQQSTPGYSNIFPLAELTAPSQINQDLSVGSKSQKLVTSRNGNHGVLSSVVTGSQQETQTHSHTNSRHHDQSRAPHKTTGELSLRTQPLSVSDTFPLSASVGTTHTSGHHQTSSERAIQSKEQSKTSHKHTHLSHSAPVHIGVPPNSVAYHDSPDTVPTSHIPGYRQSRGVLSTWDHEHYKSSHKVAAASSSNNIATSNTSKSHATLTQRDEPHRHRNHTVPVDHLSSSQLDLIPSRHVTLSSSQVPQSSLQTNVSIPSQGVSSSVKPKINSQNNIKTPARSTATVHPSESRHDQPGASASESKTRPSAPTNTFQSRPDTTLQQSISLSSHLPDPPPSRYNREVLRRPSEDSVLLKTPSSLAPTILKPSSSRTSIPASFSSQTSSRKRGLFSIFRSKSTQPPDEVEESQKSAPRKLRKESKIRAGNLLETVPSRNANVTSAVSSRAKVPPITVPIPIPPVAERKSPNRVFTPFRYLTTKRNRRVSQASLEAQDGTAPNTVIGSPTASVHSTQPPPIQPPPLRDVFAATQEWRHMEAAEVREVTGGRLRRARPGVVFDVAEDHTEEDRPKIRPQSRQS